MASFMLLHLRALIVQTAFLIFFLHGGFHALKSVLFERNQIENGRVWKSLTNWPRCVTDPSFDFTLNLQI